MLQRLEGVVLHVVKYSDKSNIVHIYTCQNGSMSFLIPAVRSRKSLVNGVLFRPFSLVEVEADVRSKAALPSIKEARLSYPLESVPYNPYKLGIVMFLAEFLSHALREEGKNEPLFAYLSSSIRWLDACGEDFANFHLVFLIRLSRFLGFYPNLENYREGDWFDMLNACFVETKPLHGMSLSPEEASHIRQLARMNYVTMFLFGMNRLERQRCLTVMMEYYRLHLPDFPELKSLDVLKELFG